MLKGGPGSPVVDVAGVREPYTAALAQRHASLARQLSLFGSGDWGSEFAGTGPYRRLVGTAVSGLHVVSNPSASAHLDALGTRLTGRFPRTSVLVPSPLAGTLSGVKVGQAVALAVNGRIAAVSVAYRNPGGGPVRFSELVAENAFRAGRNAIRVYVVSGDPAAPLLESVAG